MNLAKRRPMFPKSEEDTEFRSQMKYKHREYTLIKYVDLAVALLQKYGVGDTVERSKLIEMGEKYSFITPIDPKRPIKEQRPHRNDEFLLFRRKIDLGGKCNLLGKHQFQLIRLYGGQDAYKLDSLHEVATNISIATFNRAESTFERKKREISRVANSFAIPWPSEYSVITLAGQMALRNMQAAFKNVEDNQLEQRKRARSLPNVYPRLTPIESKMILENVKKIKEEAAKAGIVI